MSPAVDSLGGICRKMDKRSLFYFQWLEYGYFGFYTNQGVTMRCRSGQEGWGTIERQGNLKVRRLRYSSPTPQRITKPRHLRVP